MSRSLPGMLDYPVSRDPPGFACASSSGKCSFCGHWCGWHWNGLSHHVARRGGRVPAFRRQIAVSEPWRTRLSWCDTVPVGEFCRIHTGNGSINRADPIIVARVVVFADRREVGAFPRSCAAFGSSGRTLGLGYPNCPHQETHPGAAGSGLSYLHRAWENPDTCGQEAAPWVCGLFALDRYGRLPRCFRMR